jgi:predicted transcriptional regulator
LQTLLPYRAFAPRLRRELTVADLSLADVDLDCLVDVAPYMNAGAISVHPSTSLSRVHLLFRSLALRHLTVTDSMDTALGIISRTDITDAVRQPQND